MDSVYIETSIVSYLTARDSRDPVRQGEQELTKLWWRQRRAQFDLYTSQFVRDEAAAGDPVAAAERLAVVDAIQPLEITEGVESLADQLLRRGAMPPKARVDALHLAVATVNGIDFLMTWNCKHLANARMWGKMEEACKAMNVEMPRICTPHLLFDRNP